MVAARRGRGLGQGESTHTRPAKRKSVGKANRVNDRGRGGNRPRAAVLYGVACGEVLRRFARLVDVAVG
jgi:hypothetical protein